jgi:hypothetical protein
VEIGGMANILAMLLLAVTNATPALPVTTLDRLKAIPPDFWLRLAIGIGVIIALVFFLRKVAKMNKLVLAVVTFIMVTVVGFNWIYERDEPAWATPTVNFLSGFLPTKGPPPKKPASQQASWH